MKNVCLTLALLCLTLPCAARTITIDANATGDYPTIQDAVNDANAGDIIILLPGTYTGPLSCRPRLTICICRTYRLH